jgi:Zn-finger nucleic acid-binding protein
MINTCPKCRGIWLDKGEIEAPEISYERARKDTPETPAKLFNRSDQQLIISNFHLL